MKRHSNSFVTTKEFAALIPETDLVPVANILDDPRFADRQPQGRFEIDIRWLDLTEIRKKVFVDRAYQRPEMTDKIVKMARNFDPNAVGLPLAVYDSPTGRYLLVDGQQRFKVLLARGYESIPVQVVRALDLPSQSRVFRTINEGRTAIPSWVKHLNNRHARDPKAIILERCICTAGFRSGAKKRGEPKIINSHRRLMRTLEMHGESALTQGLQIFNLIWPEEPAHSYTISGIAFLLTIYPNLDIETFAIACHDAYPTLNRLMEIAEQGRPTENDRFRSDEFYALTLIRGYNRKRDTAVRLPEKLIVDFCDSVRRDKNVLFDRIERNVAAIMRSVPTELLVA